MIKVRILRWEIILEYSDGKVIIRVLIRGRQVSQSEERVM